MKTMSLFCTICLISLALWTQGCESEELGFEPADFENTSEPMINRALEQPVTDNANVPLDSTIPGIPGMVSVDESGNCIIDGVAMQCPDVNAEIRQAPIISPELEKYVNDTNCESQMIDLILALDDTLTADDFKLSAEDNAEFTELKDTFNIRYSYEDGKEFLNGMELTDELSDKFTKYMDVQRRHVSQQQLKKKSIIINEIIKTGIVIDSEALENYRNSNMSLKIRYDRCKIKDLLKIPSLSGIEIEMHPIENTLATAMQATGIAQAMSNNPNAPYGNNTGVYMSETNCPTPGYLSRYTRLNNTNPSSNERHSRNVSSIIRAVTPNSYIYCREGTVVPTDQDLAINSSTNPRIAIASFSSTYCNGVSNINYSTYDRDIDNFVLNKNIPVVIAAGNNTSDCTGNYIHSLAKGLNVNTIGNFNDNSNTPSLFRMNSISCYLDPETHNFKPEISAPGTNINAGTDTNGNTITMTGTSQATPHVAGLLANIASGFTDTSRLTAALARARLLASTYDVTVYNPDGSSYSYDRAGLGGAHYSRLQTPSFYTWLEGNYSTLSQNDPYPYNNAIDQLIQIGSNVNVLRLYLVWLNSGTWTYNHRNDSYPMGRRFTLYLYDPNGTFVTSTTNYYLGFIQSHIYLNMSGTYHVKIVLSEERDTASLLRMALVAYYY